MCSYFRQWGPHSYTSSLGPYNTQHLLTFMDTPYSDLIPEEESDQRNVPNYVNICDNVTFNRSNPIRQWFHIHTRMMMEFLLSLEVEHMYQKPSYTNGTVCCHGSSVWGLNSRCLQRLDKTLQKIVSMLHCKERYPL